MKSRGLSFCCVLALAFFSEAQSPNHLLSKHISVNELLTGYGNWENLHADRFQRGVPVKLAMPMVDVYAPSGSHVFYGGSDKGNAEFIARNFMTPSTRVPPAVGYTFRPSFAEAFKMFPTLNSSTPQTLFPGRYVILSISYKDDPCCVSQNEAIVALQKKHTSLEIIQLFIDA